MIAQTSEQKITIKCDSFPQEFFCHVGLYASAFVFAGRCFPEQMHNLFEKCHFILHMKYLN